MQSWSRNEMERKEETQHNKSKTKCNEVKRNETQQSKSKTKHRIQSATQ